MEIAIVLGGVGLVLAAVWAVADVVWHGYHFRKMSQQITTTTQNIRTHFSPRGGIYMPGTDQPYNVGEDLEAMVKFLRLIPIEMREDPTRGDDPVHHALGSGDTSSFLVRAAQNNVGEATSKRFEIMVRHLQRSDCMRLLMEFPALIPEIGVRRVCTTAVCYNINPDVPDTADNQVFPLTLTTAERMCSNPDGENDVSFTFIL
ncbi:MAG: hypothetical protein FWF24_00715 [Alphaproteobacteria bacterium]|nr:hypothetical protein [Alphaproteobacteria bacterium]